MKNLTTVILIFISSVSTQAATSYASTSSGGVPGLSVYAAAGPLLSLGSFRVGWGNWESGILAPGLFGVDKVFRAGDYYAAFGPALILSSAGVMGFYGAVGKEWGFWKYFAIRGELAAGGGFNGEVYSSAILGLEILL